MRDGKRASQEIDAYLQDARTPVSTATPS